MRNIACSPILRPSHFRGSQNWSINLFYPCWIWRGVGFLCVSVDLLRQRIMYEVWKIPGWIWKSETRLIVVQTRENLTRLPFVVVCILWNFIRSITSPPICTVLTCAAGTTKMKLVAAVLYCNPFNGHKNTNPDTNFFYCIFMGILFDFIAFVSRFYSLFSAYTSIRSNRVLTLYELRAGTS